MRTFKAVYLGLAVLLIPMQWTFFLKRGITIFHLVNMPLLAVLWGAFLIEKRPIRWHLIFPMWLIVAGSLLGMFHSESLGLNLYTLTQDLYLYLWFIALTVLFATESTHRWFVVAWACVALLVVAMDFQSLAAIGHGRSEFTFGNPNRAAPYFMVSFFLALTPAMSFLGPFRMVPPLIFLAAALATGSLGIIVSFLIGGGTFALALGYMKRGARVLLPMALLAVALGIVAVSLLSPFTETLRYGQSADHLPVILGRLPRSLGLRWEIWESGLATFVKTPLGIGPFSFYGQVTGGFGKVGRIELHSDFVAYLVERGAVGFIGLIALLAAVARVLSRHARSAAFSGDPGRRAWIAAFAAGLAGYFALGTNHEALHQESLWLLLAMAFSPVVMVRRNGSGAATPPGARASPFLRPQEPLR